MTEWIQFGGERTHITEVVSILQCNGFSNDQVFRWLERKLKIGRFAR